MKRLVKKRGYAKAKPKIICRCEEVTEEEIIQIIRQGYHSLEEIKRILRCGMGHCQGRTCLNVIARLINRETGIPLEKIKPITPRPPLKPISLAILSAYNHSNN